MADEKKEDLKKRVDAITTRNFSITRCPEKVWEDFVEFCKNETGDNYSMGIKVLLDVYKTNAKELMLFQKIIDLESKFDVMTAKPVSKEVKTFGQYKFNKGKNKEVEKDDTGSQGKENK